MQKACHGSKIIHRRGTSSGAVTADRGGRNKHLARKLDIGNISFIHDKTQAVAKILILVFIIRFHANDFTEAILEISGKTRYAFLFSLLQKKVLICKKLNPTSI